MKNILILIFVIATNVNANDAVANFFGALSNEAQESYRATQCATPVSIGIVCPLPYNTNVKIGEPCWCPSYYGPINGTGAKFIKTY